MARSEEYIPVGRISGAFGVRGWVKVYSYTEPRSNILEYTPLFLSRQGQWIEVKVSGGHVQGKGIVMGLANVTDRDQAQPLIGSELAIRKSQLEPVGDDEFYWRDLEGCRVVNEKDETLGLVDHLLETGANDVLVVKAEGDGEECLIPFVFDAFIKQVDVENKVIRVDWERDY